MLSLARTCLGTADEGPHVTTVCRLGCLNNHVSVCVCYGEQVWFHPLKEYYSASINDFQW